MHKGMMHVLQTLWQSLEMSTRTQTAEPFQLLSFSVSICILCFTLTAQDSPVLTFSHQDSASWRQTDPASWLLQFQSPPDLYHAASRAPNP